MLILKFIVTIQYGRRRHLRINFEIILRTVMCPYDLQQLPCKISELSHESEQLKSSECCKHCTSVFETLSA